MSKDVKTISRFIGGIADYTTEGSLDSYAYGRNINVRKTPQQITLQPKPIKESGSTIKSLPKWGEYVGRNNTTYIYDEAGNIYSRSSERVYTLLHNVPDSHGNGLSYFAEDDYVYYTSDKKIGRYGPISATTPTFINDFFGSQGGTPLNTASLNLEAGLSQSASRADTATLSVTGNLSLEAQIKPESLPTSGNTMSIVSKWTDTAGSRSYKFGIGTVSNFFGDSSNGAYTVSSNVVDVPIDSACTGTSGSFSLTATNASFAAGQVILIHQTQGVGAGQSQLNKIQSYTAGTITLTYALNATYTTGAQVLVLKQYTTVTIDAGKTLTAKAWNGTTGGILGFFASTSITVNGTISATGKGFRGADRPDTTANSDGKQGESYASSTYNQLSTSANYGGGGGGNGGVSGGGGTGGGGGVYASIGENYTIRGITAYNGVGNNATPGNPAGQAGNIYGGSDLTATLFFGSGGGSGGNSYASGAPYYGGAGGNGGGIIFIASPTITIAGNVAADGNQGAVMDLGHANGAGGGGAGGSIIIYTQTATLGTSLVTANGGLGGYNTNAFPIPGGSGGSGRIHIDYLTSYTGTTTPTLYATEDDTLGSTTGYTLFLALSSNGTATESYSKPATIVIDSWQHVAVSWTAATSTAEFFLNGSSLGTIVGAFTSIHDNASVFNVGCDKNSGGTSQNFYDGLIDEVRVWSTPLQESDYTQLIKQQVNVASAGLQAYYSFNSVATDSTANGNNLTLNNTPSYSTDVPFSSPTTRVDIDQESITSGNTTTLSTTIAETSDAKKTFIPAKDPQKSIEIYVESKGAGSGSWTITVHDQYNNTIATSTIAKSLLSTGLQEFVFSDVWRPLTNFTNTYHFHITDSDGTGTVRSGSANDLSTINYTSYYQFLVQDTSWHPIAKMLQFLVIGNERYVAKYEATLYEPNKISLPAGYRVRCFGYWNEYLAIGTVKGSTVTEQDTGRVYFWDGIAPTYNFFIDVPEGGINALHGTKGKLFIWAGYQGDLLEYMGGASGAIVKHDPKITSDKYMEIYPGAVTMWKSLLRYGSCGNSNSTEIDRGVYGYGSVNVRYPDILTHDYAISTGNTNSVDLRIGMLLPVNQQMLIGWQDGSGYGVDYIDDNNDCVEYGTIEFLVDDGDNVWKEKIANTFVARFKELSAGQSFVLKYRINDQVEWTLYTDSTSQGDTEARIIIPNGRYNELQCAVDMYSTSGESPVLLGVGIESDNRALERRV